MSNFDSKMSDFDFVRNRPRKENESLEPPKTPRKFQTAIGIYLTVVLGLIYVIARMLIFAAPWTVNAQIIETINYSYDLLFLIVVIFNYFLFYFTLIEPFRLKGKIYQNNSPEAREKRRYLALFVTSLISIRNYYPCLLCNVH